jgi:hypothetical protein
VSDEWTERLSDYVDDELGWRERRRLEGHLRDCSDCRVTLAELRAVVEHARRLPHRPPVADLWPGIAERLSSKRQAGAASRWASLRQAGLHIHLTLPQLAFGAALLIAAASGVLWVTRHRVVESPADTTARAATDARVREAPAAQPDDGPYRTAALPSRSATLDRQYDLAMADLQAILAQERGRLDPHTVDVFQRSLATMDRAIGEARQAVAREPGDEYLHAHLEAARRRKLDLLRRAVAMMQPS